MAANDVPALLVVDDDDQIRDVVTRALVQAGYTVRSAVNGREALTVLQSYVPQLILLDLVMPEISGVKVLQTIRNDAKLSHIPVIIMSGSIWPPEETRAMAQFFLTKPFTVGELRAAVNRFLPDVPLQAKG